MSMHELTKRRSRLAWPSAVSLVFLFGLSMMSCDTMGTDALLVENQTDFSITCSIVGRFESQENSGQIMQEKIFSIDPGERKVVYSVTHLGSDAIGPGKLGTIAVQSITVRDAKGNVVFSQKPIMSRGWTDLAKKNGHRNQNEFILVISKELIKEMIATSGSEDL